MYFLSPSSYFGVVVISLDTPYMNISFCINLSKLTSEKTSECRFFSLEVEDPGFTRGNNVSSSC